MSGAIGSFVIGASPIGGTSTSTGTGTGGSNWFAPPPTRILSWEQMCVEADPGFRQKSLRPWVYEFLNGRLFVDPLPLYDFGGGITDDFGTPIRDDFGTQIQSDVATGTNTGTATGFAFGVGSFGDTPF